MKIGIFIPCYIDQFYPKIGMKMLRFFKELNYSVFVSPKSFCCGQPACNSGFQEEAKTVLKRFIIEYSNVDYIVIPSASCAGFLKNYAPELLDFNSKKYNPNFVDTVTKIYDFAQFVDHKNILDKKKISFPHKVAYHASCASLRENKSHQNAINILNKIQGLELVSFEYADTCCGFGGTFAEKFSDIALSMGKHKLDMLKKTNVEYIVSNDSSCLFHLKNVAEKLNYHFRFLNMVELF